MILCLLVCIAGSIVLVLSWRELSQTAAEPGKSSPENGHDHIFLMVHIIGTNDLCYSI